MKKQYPIYYLPAFIAVLTFVIYLKALKNDFVLWDDDLFVYENLNIRSFDYSFLKWAVTDVSLNFWQPFTWISIAFDHIFWGLNPFGYHLTNILFHAANTFLAVHLIVKLLESAASISRDKGLATTLDRPSILISAGVTGLLFGIHPLHVETVAWITARNDLIATFFLLLCLLSYTRHVGSPRNKTLHSNLFSALPDRDYLFVTLFFILALATKPTAVILPPLLIILDWHPFGKIRSLADFSASILNKLPLIALSSAVSLATLILHKSRGGILPQEMVSLPDRLLLAAKSLIIYLAKMVIPLHLIPYYPLPDDISFLKIEYLLPVVLVALISVGCILAVKKQRTLLAVWSVYIVTLLPVIGIISVREVAMADRYAYLSSIGPFLLAGLGFTWFWNRCNFLDDKRQWYKIFISSLAITVVVSLSVLTLRQISVWNSTISLWSYVIEQGPYRVPIAFNNRGTAYYDKGETSLALKDYNTAIELNPYYAYAYYNRGVLSADKGEVGAAMEDFTRAINLNPSDFAPYLKRGLLFQQQGAFDPALTDFSTAIKLNPSAVEAYINRGVVYRLRGDYERALLDYGRALEINPTSYLAYSNRGIALAWIGKTNEALEDFTKAISLNPDYAKAYLYRGGLYERSGSIQSALEDYQMACKLGSAEGCNAIAVK
jgi:protein O-mannosyl-transferase